MAIHPTVAEEFVTFKNHQENLKELILWKNNGIKTHGEKYPISQQPIYDDVEL